MLLEIYVRYFNEEVEIAHSWNKDLLSYDDVNRFIVEHYDFYSLFRHNNDKISTKLFKK